MVQLPEHACGWRRLTTALRYAPLLIAALHLTGRVALDAWVARFWGVIHRQPWCHEAMAEAHVAAFSFFVWIVVFRSLDTLKVTKQFRFVQRPPQPPLTFLKNSWEAVVGGGNREHDRLIRVWASFPVYLGAIAALHMVKAAKPLEDSPPSFNRLIGEIGFGICAYDFVFYWLHLAMHLFPRLPHGHGIHHALVEANSDGRRVAFLEAESVVNHSLVDGALQVGVNILVQNMSLFGMPKHKMSRFIHNALVTYLLVEAHAGLDLPWCTHRIFPEVFGGAFRHEIHHQSHKSCFHQFFKYLDDFFGYGPPQAAPPPGKASD